MVTLEQIQTALAEALKQRTMTQEELAKMIGTTRQTIISIEKNFFNSENNNTGNNDSGNNDTGNNDSGNNDSGNNNSGNDNTGNNNSLLQEGSEYIQKFTNYPCNVVYFENRVTKEWGDRNGD